ncbi:hypothetical protein XBP1_1390001 [Xenorhabdus bovienii str. puntauvense]|uniref:Uncharacterized protein n=1 Tax=Xenorhabdus bovienii str. puntauvense TaxID=1398201 RepID=A0A077N0G8_XENBV|nr:hypothetical protein XBP1_1390001 [Xenorhabdus bovienii str. puntauvense]
MILILLMGAISYFFRIMPFLISNKKIGGNGFVITALNKVS